MPWIEANGVSLRYALSGPENNARDTLVLMHEAGGCVESYDDALPELTQASQATEEHTLVRLAEMSYRFNLWQESVDVLRRNVDLHPKSAQALWNLAHAYAETWQMELALAPLAQAEARPPWPGGRPQRGRFLL